MSAKFTDAKGREWLVHIDVNVLRRIREKCGIDQLQSQETMEALFDDPLACVDCLDAILQPELKDISKEDFGAGFYGDAADDAFMALRRAIVDFFPKSRRDRMNRVLDEQEKMEKRLLEHADSKIEEMVGKVEENAKRKMEEILMSGGLSLNSPASPDLTPAR